MIPMTRHSPTGPGRRTIHATRMLALLASTSLLLFTGCEQGDVSGPVAPLAPDEAPAAEIQDGSNDGNPGFLFLAPLVSQPDKRGQSPLAGLAPHVVICELEEDGGGNDVCSDNSVTFSGSDIQYDGDHYKLKWDTRDTSLAVETGPYIYRLTVYLGSEPLGFADLQFRGKGAKNAADPESGVIGLKKGRTVPVKFFIGDALGCVTGLDCKVATIDPSVETTIFTRDGDAAIYIPEGALPPLPGGGPYVLTIAELDPDDASCDLGVELKWFNSCYEYNLLPDPEVEFAKDVIVAQCIDTAAVQAFYGTDWEDAQDELVLGAHHDDPPAGSPTFELLPNVPGPPLTCADYIPGAGPSGAFAFLQKAGLGVRDFIFGTPAYAGHTGFGGSARDLSTIAWVDPGLRIAGFDLERGGWSSIESAKLAGAMAALEGHFLNVWPTTASRLDNGLLHDEVDVVLLGSVKNGANVGISQLDADEQNALLEYVEHGGCAILLADNGAFAAANASLLDPFGLSVTGSKTGAVAGSGALGNDISELLQFYPGWFIEPAGPATVFARQADYKAAAVTVPEGSLGVGPYSGPAFAFSDVNMFWSNSIDFSGGRFDSADNAQLFVSVVDACGFEPKL